MTYGTDSSADVRITEFGNQSKDGKPLGLFVKLSADESSVSITMDGVFGKSQAYAAAAAAAVGLNESLNLTTIAEALALYEGARGRTRLIPGIKDSYIIDDTYNASPISGEAAINILEDLGANKKIAVLGDMLELGEYTEQAHLELGKRVANVADSLVTVGARAGFIAEGARNAGLEEDKINSFDTSDEANREALESFAFHTWPSPPMYLVWAALMRNNCHQSGPNKFKNNRFSKELRKPEVRNGYSMPYLWR